MNTLISLGRVSEETRARFVSQDIEDAHAAYNSPSFGNQTVGCTDQLADALLLNGSPVTCGQ